MALFSALFLGVRPSRSAAVGLTLIFVGAAAIVGVTGVGTSLSQLFGQILLLSASAIYAGYTLLGRRAGLSPLHAAAVVSVLSAMIFLPIYVLFLHPTLDAAPFSAVLFQALYQGVLISLVSLIGWTRALELLGPVRLAPFASLVPVLTLFAAIPILGEVPTPAEWIGTVLISLGVPLAAGVLGRRRKAAVVAA